MSDDFEKKLLTGDGKWWEFFNDENEIKQPDHPPEDFSDQLDWSKKRALDRAQGPIGLGFFHRCIQCNKAIPPDLTFCVYCGGTPRADRRSERFAIVVNQSEDSFSIDEAALWISEAIPGTNRSEIASILSDPPAVFSIIARRDQVSTLCARMNDIGIYANGYLMKDAPVNWVRETGESALRSPLKMGVMIVLTAAIIYTLFFLNPMLILPILAITFGLGSQEFRWYQEKYTIDTTRALNHASGFNQMLIEESVYLLKHIRDTEIKELLSICLMEYYSLSQGFRAEQNLYGDVLEHARNHLSELLESIFGICETYSKLEKLEHPRVIQQKVHELKSRPNAELFKNQISEFEKQVRVAEKNIIAMEKIKAQFRIISLKMEALRTRFLQIRERRDRDSSHYDLDTILAELDLELEIAEETIHSVEVN